MTLCRSEIPGQMTVVIFGASDLGGSESGVFGRSSRRNEGAKWKAVELLHVPYSRRTLAVEEG